MPAGTTVLGNGVNGRVLAAFVVAGVVNVYCGDDKLGFGAVAFAALAKATVAVELNALLGQLQPMKVGGWSTAVPPQGGFTMITANFEIRKQSRRRVGLSLPEG